MRLVVALEDDYRDYPEMIAVGGFPMCPCSAALAISALRRWYYVFHSHAVSTLLGETARALCSRTASRRYP